MEFSTIFQNKEVAINIRFASDLFFYDKDEDDDTPSSNHHRQFR